MRGKLTISLDAIRNNYGIVAAEASSAHCAAVVKADAYGLGIAPVAKTLLDCGVDVFFVALPEEGQTLRAIADNATIFVLNGILAGEEEFFAAHRLVPVLNHDGALALWRDYARKRGTVLDAAIHVDTGLNRLGFDVNDVADLDVGGLNLRLVMSHLACADMPDHWMNREQLNRFTQAAAHFPNAMKSLAASDGVFCGADFHFDMVRPGAALYGINPIPSKATPVQNAVQLSVPVLQTRVVTQNGTVGYGVSCEVKAGQKLATVSLGYADGFMRSLSNQGHLYFGEAALPVLGRVSMDVIVVDISALPEDSVRAGTMLDVFSAAQTPDMLAIKAGTIGYEMLTTLGRRFERVYV